ncbi:uncharacterized protein LOC136092905 [Hydra vulgaris]|uniref:uncharacterized protein LOC136092905 n=1 Tax=Hydra vulgaris TaxID=6087 RepID=UPI0032EA44BD
MVDHCTAEKLLEHFLELVEKVKLNIKFMLHIGIDGPNVNVKFERLLKSSEKMKNLNKNISIGTCPLHIVHNAFRAGVNVLNFNIDSFAIDVNFFFKHSAARRSDYRQIENLTEIILHFIQRHSSTRWVTLRRICSQILEQHKNLCKYYIKFLPTTTSFKSTFRDTERYKRITDILQNEILMPYISFIAFIANDFEIFLKTFQSIKPRIHLIYSEMSKLFVALMSKFIKTKLLYVNNNGSNSIKYINELLMIDVIDSKNCKPLKLIDIGTKAKSYFSEALEISCGEKKFRQNCLESYQAFTSYLKLKLP